MDISLSKISVDHMIIGLTPFLYLQNTTEAGNLQAGISDKRLARYLYNREKSGHFGRFSLTGIRSRVMINLLGRLEYRPFSMSIGRGGRVCFFGGGAMKRRPFDNSENCGIL